MSGSSTATTHSSCAGLGCAGLATSTQGSFCAELSTIGNGCRRRGAPEVRRTACKPTQVCQSSGVAIRQGSSLMQGMNQPHKVLLRVSFGGVGNQVGQDSGRGYKSSHVCHRAVPSFRSRHTSRQVNGQGS